MYNCSGSVAHHNSDLWGDSAPQDNWVSSTFWSQGLAWLVTHIWDYYLFTQDVNFLRANIAPLKDAALFYTDFLTDYKGWKVTNVSLNPTFDWCRARLKKPATLANCVAREQLCQPGRGLSCHYLRSHYG